MVETQKDGTVTTTETTKNGVKIKTVDEPGEDVTAEITVPKSVGEAVVIIPADVDCGTVAVDTDTGEVVKLSVPTKEGMTVKLADSAELVLVDRSRNFDDTRNHWAKDAINFATAHELFSGTSDTAFTPDSPMTRAMLMTVLARFDGQDTTGGAVWYEKAMEWARRTASLTALIPTVPSPGSSLPPCCGAMRAVPLGGSLSSFRGQRQRQRLRPGGCALGRGRGPNLRYRCRPAGPSGQRNPGAGGHHPHALCGEPDQVK